VDALCIVQDSANAEDWKSVSAVMDEIYGNATLTLAASAAKDTSQGIILFPGKGRSAGYIPYCLKKGVIAKAYFQFNRLDEDGKQPLATRAWAFQEYAMSSRIVSFQTNTLVWDCDSIRLYSNGLIVKASNIRHRTERGLEGSRRGVFTLRSNISFGQIISVSRDDQTTDTKFYDRGRFSKPLSIRRWPVAVKRNRTHVVVCRYSPTIKTATDRLHRSDIFMGICGAFYHIYSSQSLYAACIRSNQLPEALDVQEVRLATRKATIWIARTITP